MDIAHFRGIEHLSWRIPKGTHFQALIGPGDSAKSTILSAIDMALSDRWNLSVADTDFYECNVEEPISIRVALSDLPPEIRQHDALGMSLAGIDDAGELYEDPDDDHDPCVVVALTVDKNLEPAWTAYRPNKPEPIVTVTATARRLLGAYKIDERVDNHLRWSRTSALGRLTEAKHGTNELLLNASREARSAVSAAIPPELSELVETVEQRLHTLGSGEFTDLKPGLDQSLSTSTGNLALYEGEIPLTNYGLGSRRLAGVAVQQLANADKGIILIDEIEYGLEPHRLVNLLTCIKDRTTSSLALVTTHSPTALRNVDVNDLAIVRRSSLGNVTVQSFAPDHTELQKVLRSSPEAFLARRVVLVEGATEYGFVLQLLDGWNRELAATGEPSSGALGVEVVSGSGGATIGWARVLADLGYDVVLLIDSDVEKDCVAADALTAQGVAVVRWKDPFHLERAATDVLNATELTALLEKAIELSDDPLSSGNNYLVHLKKCGLPEEVTTLAVNDWIELGVDIEAARDHVARAAHKLDWFKKVHKGRELAALVLAAEGYAISDTASKIQSLREAMFESALQAESDIAVDADVTGSGEG
ncbi:ATP-dependent endonuclease [Microtetraspora sp. AC03309]|uniref:ATP-dependent nuclease n=1 Tax=Microtetraspora sp. AC03309 TaxID=2779376 RepID=UPI001E6446ED|nr:ATP-binding protein [Microtetraspora sp. AC03309]